MRIHITGNAGAGKTTLAQNLSAQFGIECHHLDQIVWKPHWQKPTMEERSIGIAEITSGESWIIEGVARTVREKSDLVIFLDVPRYLCLWRCLKRNLPYLLRSRPELPEHCPEILILPKLLRIIWNFPANSGAEIRREARESNRYIVVHDASQLSGLFEGFVHERVA